MVYWIEGTAEARTGLLTGCCLLVLVCCRGSGLNGRFGGNRPYCWGFGQKGHCQSGKNRSLNRKDGSQSRYSGGIGGGVGGNSRGDRSGRGSDSCRRGGDGVGSAPTGVGAGATGVGGPPTGVAAAAFANRAAPIGNRTAPTGVKTVLTGGRGGARGGARKGCAGDQFFKSQTSETWQPRPLPPKPGSPNQLNVSWPWRVAASGMGNYSGWIGRGGANSAAERPIMRIHFPAGISKRFSPGLSGWRSPWGAM
jgi:hypothetical protein